MIPAGSQRSLTARSSSIPNSPISARQVGRVVAADRVVVRDRAAGGDDRARHGVLHRPPTARPDRRPARPRTVKYSEAPLGYRCETWQPTWKPVQRAAHGAVERLEVAPGGRGLERLDEHAAVHQVVAQVRAREARALPGAARLRAQRPRAAAQQRPRRRRTARRALPAAHQQAAPVDQPAREPARARQRDAQLRLLLVGQPRDVGRDPGLLERPQQLGALQERADGPAVERDARAAAAPAAPRA